jgi:hypothetical protein
VTLEALGDESALGFSLDFDLTKFRFEGVALGSSAGGATLNVNTNMLGLGRIGLALSLPIGTKFGGGSHELITMTMAALPNATGGALLAFSDQPVLREVSDEFANVLSVDYQAGLLRVVPVLSITLQGTNLVLSWPSWAADYQLQSSPNLNAPVEWSPVTGVINPVDDELQVMLPVEGAASYYRLSR